MIGVSKEAESKLLSLSELLGDEDDFKRQFAQKHRQTRVTSKLKDNKIDTLAE
jgi:phage shock protein A